MSENTDSWPTPPVLFKFDGPLREPAVAESTTSAFQSPLTRDKQTTLSTCQPTAGLHSYGLQKAEGKRKLVENELKGPYAKLDPNLLDTFFPEPKEDDAFIKGILRELGSMYGEVDRQPAKGSTGRRDGPNLTRGWRKMPSPPAGKARLPPYKELDITAAFVQILNAIITHLNLSDRRVAVDRQNNVIPTRDGGTLKPDVFLWGKGSSSFPHIGGTPLSRTPTQSEAASHRQVVGEARPPIDWPWCVIPIEVKTDFERGGQENKKSLYQLGTYVREVFVSQENRRFVPSLILTECTVEFLIWDRAGVVASERLDYHTEHRQFCWMLASLVSWDDEQLGFDPNLYYREQQLHIRTKGAVDYVVEKTLVRSYTIRGRGSTCWRVRKLEDDHTRCVVQDSWVVGGIVEEQTILRRIEDARGTQGIWGIPSLVHIEDVEIPLAEVPVEEFPVEEVPVTTRSRLDTIVCNRRSESLEGTVNLIHTRTVLRCEGPYCKLLEKFTSPLELVGALHDVIKSLGEAHYKTGVLHRDIVPWNILIQPSALEGSRGILIDFSCAISGEDATLDPRAETTPGSHIFRSCNSLAGVASSHLDDLESFYWLLCFIIALHKGPDLATSRLAKTPSEVVGWLSEDEEAAAIAKIGHLRRDFNLPVQDWFRPLELLARNLHHFFHSRIEERKELGEALPSPDAREDYKEFVGRFAQAIQELEWPDGVVFNDNEIDQEVENMFRVTPKRELDDPDPPGPTHRKRMRVRDRNPIGPIIELVERIVSEAGREVEISYVLPI